MKEDNGTKIGPNAAWLGFAFVESLQREVIEVVGITEKSREKQMCFVSKKRGCAEVGGEEGQALSRLGHMRSPNTLRGNRSTKLPGHVYFGVSCTATVGAPSWSA